MVGLDAARIIGQTCPFVKEDARMIEFFNPPDAPAPGAFSRATRAAGLIFVSGTGAGNDTGGAAPSGTAAEQTRKALENVSAILRAAGSSLERVVQMTLLITDPADYREINAEYVTHFPGGLPARHTARFGVPTTAKVAFACIALADGR
jgi:2-iminobutanoate/2-iminopropanoate deaminase